MRYVVIIDECPGDQQLDCWVISERESESRVGWQTVDALTADQPPIVANGSSEALLALLARAGHSSRVRHSAGQTRRYQRERRSQRRAR